MLAWRSDDKALRCSHVRGIPDGVVSVAAGKRRCVVATAAGDVYSWDSTDEKEKEAAPFRVAGIKRVVSVCVGEKHSLALQRIARPPRETILTLADEEDDADEYAGNFAGDLDDVDEVTASLEAMYSTAADDVARRALAAVEGLDRDARPSRQHVVEVQRTLVRGRVPGLRQQVGVAARDRLAEFRPLGDQVEQLARERSVA